MRPVNHIEAERLAGLALGDPEPLTDEQARHLESCRDCQAELAELREITHTARHTDPIAVRVPGPDLLSRIDAELAGDTAPNPVGASGAIPAGAHEADGFVRTADPQPRSGRRSRGLVLLAAAVGLVLGVGGTVAYERAQNPDERVVATTNLAALPGQSGGGRAELVRADGVDSLRVQVDSATPAGEFRELWLINADGRRMIALGVLDASGRGSYPLPGQLAGGLQDYTIVDVSLEPYDGDAAHSQASVVRGTLA